MTTQHILGAAYKVILDFVGVDSESIFFSVHLQNRIRFCRRHPALIACWILADSSDCCMDVNPYSQWQKLLIDTSLKSIFGYREPHEFDWNVISANNPYNPNLTKSSSETVMWTTFCERLEQCNFQPHIERWFNGDVADEYGVMCYMETAWEFYNFSDFMFVGPIQPGVVIPKQDKILNACAIDEGHRYIFNINTDRDQSYYGEYIIFKQ